MKSFTLTECLVVIVLMAILAAVVMPAFSSVYDSVKLESAYRQLMQDIRYVQQLSIARQERHGIYFSSAGNSYFAYRQTIGDIIINPATHKQLSVFFGIAGNPAVIMINSSYGTPGGVEFDSLGATYSTEGVSSGGEITLTYKGINRIIIIEANTGRIQ